MVCKYWNPPRQLKKYLKFHKFFSRWRISTSTDLNNLQELRYLYINDVYPECLIHTSVETKKKTFLEHFLSLPQFYLLNKLCFFLQHCLVVYQLSKSVRLLLAAEVSTLLSDLGTRSARLCVLGTWGAVWRWPLTLIKGSTALFGSYQFNQLAHCCSCTIHDTIPSLSACLSERTALLPHTELGSCQQPHATLPFILNMIPSCRKLPSCWKGGQQIGSLVLFQYYSWIFSGSSRWCLNSKFHVCYMLSKN